MKISLLFLNSAKRDKELLARNIIESWGWRCYRPRALVEGKDSRSLIEQLFPKDREVLKAVLDKIGVPDFFIFKKKNTITRARKRYDAFFVEIKTATSAGFNQNQIKWYAEYTRNLVIPVIFVFVGENVSNTFIDFLKRAR